MKKNLLLLFVLAAVAGSGFAKERIAVLPFTGWQNDEGQTIAELFSFVPQFGDAFAIIPRTSITQAINREQNFQMGSGMTDADTIVSIGQQVGARYVLAGSITIVGNNNLLVVSIMDISNLRQIAGDYQTYNRIEEIQDKLPNMTANIVQATQENTSPQEKLAVVPVQLESGADQLAADTLAQILSIELIRTGAYTVYPRTQTLEQVTAEHNTQMSGVTADGSQIGIGRGENPNYVLSVVARRLGANNMFNAVIIDLSSGVQILGRSTSYGNINEGINAMQNLAVNLTGTPEQIAQRQAEEEQRRQAAERQQEQQRLAEDRQREEQRKVEERQRLAEERKRERQRKAEERKDKFLRDSGVGLGVNAGLSIASITSAEEPALEGSGAVFFVFGVSPELLIGRHFSIQPELQFTMPYYKTPEEKKGKIESTDKMYPIMQTPLLLRGRFGTFSLFGGMGYNIPLQSDVSSPPFSAIGGFRISFNYYGFLPAFLDARFIYDFGETGLKTHYGNFTGQKMSFDISLGLKGVWHFR
jgi:TolB-like protein